MKMIRILLQKEFRQIFRDKSILPLIFVMPIIQLLIIPLAADYEVKNINLAVTDHDHSVWSEKLVKNITASGYFRLVDYNQSYEQSLDLVEREKADIVLEIPRGFETGLVRENAQNLMVSVNAINGVKAGLGGSYLGNIIAGFNQEIRMKWVQQTAVGQAPVVEIASANRFNPNLNYRFFMVPGILAILVTMIGGYMSALNIVKEKEVGTIEQINVTPIKKHQFILGKLLPFWILGIFVFSVGLFVVSRLVYGIVPAGSILLLYGFLAIYLVAILGFGLLISTYSDTQQQAMSVAFFFVMIFLLMSGLFTPINSMPDWAKWIAKANPVSYFIEVIRMIILKGSGLAEISTQLLITFGFAAGLNTWAILNYRKRN